jgi:hypothetical protein
MNIFIREKYGKTAWVGRVPEVLFFAAGETKA